MFKQISIPPGKLLFRSMRGCKCIHLWQPYRWDNPLYRAQIKAACVGNMFSLFEDELSSHLSQHNTSFHFSIQCLCGKPMLSLLLNDCEGAVVFLTPPVLPVLFVTLVLFLFSCLAVFAQNWLSACCEADFCSTKSNGSERDCAERVCNSACWTSWRPPIWCVSTCAHDGSSQREFRGCWWALFRWPYLCCCRRPSFRPCRPVNVRTLYTVYVETHHIWNHAVSQCDRKWKLRKWHQEVIQPPLRRRLCMGKRAVMMKHGKNSCWEERLVHQ